MNSDPRLKYVILLRKIYEFKNVKYIFNHLTLLYDRKYFFNLENNTTGIKNLLLNSFMKNIKIVISNNIKNIFVGANSGTTKTK